MTNEEIISIILLILVISFIVFLLSKLYFEKKINKIKYENILNIQKSENAFLNEKNSYKTLINEINSEYKNSISEYELKISHLNKLSDQNKLNLEEKLDLLEESKDQMKYEFENLSNKLYEENSLKSNENLSLVLKPLKDQLDGFKNRINEIYSDESKERSSLLSEIKNLKDLNNQISADANNLSKALKGENKTQGDWGEMILSKVLESSGLREGKEFSTQGSYLGIDGNRLRPDVIVHLPQNKDIIIDSKVSLLSYTRYVQAENKDDKNKYFKELKKSVSSHISDLSSKQYNEIKDINTLDFVLLFIPIEGAFLLLSQNEENIFQNAFDKNIILVSPSSLYVSLRTIENIWRYEYQNENALLISKKAADMYDKFYSFVQDLEEIGTNIKRSQKAYDLALNKLSTGNGNLIKRSEEFISLGVKTKNKIKIKQN
ncbi:MAG: DNA recombination protein RmuC [Campylobacteraceae bacterium]|nr:DNA recombination protein RmuC [Campylobacteraceae bacterium]